MGEQKGEDYYRALIENARDVITILNDDGTIRYTSPSNEALSGYTHEELRRRNPFEDVHPDDAPGIARDFAELLECPGESREVQYRIRSKGGDWRHVQAVGTNLLDHPDIRGIVINSRDITEQKRAEQALRESEEYYRVLIQDSADIVTIIDAAGIITYESDSIRNLLGYEPEELVGRNVFELIHPDDVPELLKDMEKYSRQPGVIVMKSCRFLHKNGSWRYMEGTGKNLLEHPAVRGIILNSRDVTERRSAEEEAQKLASIVRHSGELVNLADPEGKMIFLNEAGGRMLGLDPGKIEGVSILEVIPEHLRDLVLGEMLPTLRKGAAWEGELQYRNLKTGELVDVYASTFTITDQASGEISCMANVSRDITERKRTMQRLERLNRCFLELGTDSGGNIGRIVSAGYEVLDATLLKYCAAKRNTRYICSAGGLAVEPLTSSVAACPVFETGRCDRPQAMDDLSCLPEEEAGPFMDKYGLRSLLSVAVKANDEKTGTLCFFERAVRDFTYEEKELLSMLARALSIEEERLRYQEDMRDFIDIASHELRHPITVMKGYAVMLRDQRAGIDESTREIILDIIEHGADRLNRLVQGLLDISRIERGRFEVSREEQPLVPLIERALEEIRMRGFNNEFRLEISGEPGDCLVDGEKIVQLMVILLENAVKYSPSGNPIEVEVKVEAGEQGAALVTVKDRGIGVAEPDRERVFERFFQVEEAAHHSTPGMGMGLYIARNIVEAHGGRIRAEPREGGGSAFRFTLPRTPWLLPPSPA